VTSATAQGSIKDNFQKFIFNLYKLTSVRLDKQISLLVLTLWLVSCNGPRNIYSASPFVSPVPLTKGATAIEANYFTHTRERNLPDSLPNHDNCIGFNISHMLKERTLLFATADIKKERNQYDDSVPLVNDPSYNRYDAGFDSSVVFAKRKTFSAGIEFFSKEHGKAIKSTAILVGLNQCNMNESGLLRGTAYQRFYKINQLSISLQQNFLFNISSSFKLAWITRLTILNNFEANTDYSSEEKLNAGLRDKKVNAFFCLTGLYADYLPLKNVPIHINGQFFNDGWIGKHPMAKYELGEVHIKGTGVSAGIKYVFK
jgi:hypothetical protein